MYVITDKTSYLKHKTAAYDGKDVGDIIIGITGNKEDEKRIMDIVFNMEFGDALVNRRYSVECVEDWRGLNA